MIPLATPRDGELLNLSQIVQIKMHPKGECDDCTIKAHGDYLFSDDKDATGPETVHHADDDRSCTVYFSDGRTEIYTGEEARRLNSDMQVMLKLFRDSVQAVFEPPPAITPPANTGVFLNGFRRGKR